MGPETLLSALIPTEILGTLPGWLSAGGILGILTLLSRHVIASRKAALEEKKQDDFNEGALRDHYAQEVHELRNKLAVRDKEFRQDLIDLETRYQNLLETTETRYRRLLDDSEAEVGRLRARVNEVEDELRGLVRIITQASADKVISLDSPVPSDISAAAARVDALLSGKPKNP